MVPHARLTDTHGHRCAPFSISGRGYFTRYSHIPGAHKAQVFQYLTFLLKEGAEGTNQQAWISVGAPCITELLRCISAPLLLTETWDLCSQVSNHSQKPKVYVSQQPRTWTVKMLKACTILESENSAEYSVCRGWPREGKVSFAQTCSCTQSCNLKPAQIGHVSVVIGDGLHQLATSMLTTSTRMEASLHQHNTSEERRPEINSAAGEAQRSSCSH